MALDKLKYTYQDPAKVSELNVDDVLNVTNTINTTTINSKAEIISPIGSNVALTLKSASNANYDLQQFKNISDSNMKKTICLIKLDSETGNVDYSESTKNTTNTTNISKFFKIRTQSFDESKINNVNLL
jgi:hypothetical protein